MLAIFKKEMRQYFITPVGYVYIAVYLAVSGFAFSMFTVQTASSGSDAQVNVYFTVLMFIFSVLVPLLTMRIFADERKMRRKSDDRAGLDKLNGRGEIPCSLLNVCRNLPYLAFRLLRPVQIRQTAARPFRLRRRHTAFRRRFVAIGLRILAYRESDNGGGRNDGDTALDAERQLLQQLYRHHLDTNRAELISIYSRFGNFTYGVFDFTALLYYAR